MYAWEISFAGADERVNFSKKTGIPKFKAKAMAIEVIADSPESGEVLTFNLIGANQAMKKAHKDYYLKRRSRN
jgi:hypothetical protein